MDGFLNPVWLRLPAIFLIPLWLPACRKPEMPVMPPPIVEVMPVAKSEVPLSTTLIGQLDSPQNVEVRARVEGVVDKMLFTEGVEVKAGDLLFELDKKPFVEALAAANGALGEARATLKKYEKDVARLQPLTLSRAVPQQDVDNAMASVEVGKAGVKTAEAKVQSAEIDLGYCEIKAPLTGLIGARQVAIGGLVGKGEPTLLATISALDPIWFYCNISEVEYLKAEQESRASGRTIATVPVHLNLSNGQELPDPGRFVFIDRAVDPKTGTLRIRAEFANKDKLLRPGMFARIRVETGTRKDCIELPERAMVELQGKTFVWIISPEGKASQRPVKVGGQVGSNFLITEGIEPGERVVLEGLQKVREGAPVNALTAAQLTALKSAAAAPAKPATP